MPEPPPPAPENASDSHSPGSQSPVREAPTIFYPSPDAPPRPRTDWLTVEEPLELRVQGTSLAVLMRTPSDDLALAAGFLLTEGIVPGPEAIVALARCDAETEGENEATRLWRGNVIQAWLAPGVPFDPELQRRNFYASSSCGLCGKASIDSVLALCPAPPALWRVAPGHVAAMPDRLRAAQPIFDRTGSLHAAGLFDLEGRILFAAEDIGRHNAVDKVVGRAALEMGWPLERTMLAVSGRISFEIAQKAALAGIGLVGAVSGASSLAVDLARERSMALIGFIREGAMTVYCGEGRLGD